MTTQRTAVVNQTTNVVDYIWLTSSGDAPPTGYAFVPSSDANVGEVYSGGVFAPVPATKAALMAYASSKQALNMHGGISVNVGTQQAPQNIEASTDPTSLVLLQGAYTLAVGPTPPASFQWVQSNGVPVTLTPAQIQTIFNAVTAFVQSTFNALSSVIGQINSGTITTAAGVDAAAWPANS